MAYLLLPTLLDLTASCSQDSLLLSLSALAVAVLSRATSERRGLSWAELVSTTILLAVCIASRPPYLPLALMLFLPALEAGGGRRSEWIAPAAGASLVFATVLAWQGLVHPLGTFSAAQAQPRPQAVFLLTHPARGALDLMMGTAREVPGLLIKGIEVLGVNDAFPPVWVYALLLAGLTGIVAFAPSSGLARRRARLLVLLLVSTIVAAISLAEYLIWTPLASQHVAGLQSRYYLPLIPFASLALGGNLRRLVDQRIGRRCMLLAAGLFIGAVLCTPAVAAHRFYGLGVVTAMKLALR